MARAWGPADVERLVSDMHDLFWVVYRRHQSLLKQAYDIQEELELIAEYGADDVGPEEIQRLRARKERLLRLARRYEELLKELRWLTELPAVAIAAAPDVLARRLERIERELEKLEVTRGGRAG